MKVIFLPPIMASLAISRRGAAASRTSAVRRRARGPALVRHPRSFAMAVLRSLTAVAAGSSPRCSRRDPSQQPRPQDQAAAHQITRGSMARASRGALIDAASPDAIGVPVRSSRGGIFMHRFTRPRTPTGLERDLDLIVHSPLGYDDEWIGTTPRYRRSSLPESSSPRGGALSHQLVRCHSVAYHNPTWLPSERSGSITSPRRSCSTGPGSLPTDASCSAGSHELDRAER